MVRSNFRTYSQALDNDALMALAPSVFATSPWGGMSDRYTFIPTIAVVDKMRAEGFIPFSAIQSKTRIEGKGDFTKHMIRFRDMRQGDAPVLSNLGQLFPEICITNAHDGGSSYMIDAGMLRAACMNGLMVSESTVNHVRARHSGNIADGVINASYEVIEQFPKVLDTAESFARLQLTDGQQNAFAVAALALKYDDNAPVSPATILRPRRQADVAPNLWNTFNKTQEALLNGGNRGFNAETRRRVTTRPVNGISENTRLNKALWTLAEEMRKLAA